MCIDPELKHTAEAEMEASISHLGWYDLTAGSLAAVATEADLKALIPQMVSRRELSVVGGNFVVRVFLLLFKTSGDDERRGLKSLLTTAFHVIAGHSGNFERVATVISKGCYSTSCRAHSTRRAVIPIQVSEVRAHFHFLRSTSVTR